MKTMRVLLMSSLLAAVFLLTPALSFAQTNPRAGKNPCAAQNPCAAKNPCALKAEDKGKKTGKQAKGEKSSGNPCAANPCAVKK